MTDQSDFPGPIESVISKFTCILIKIQTFIEYSTEIPVPVVGNHSS